MAYWKRRDLLFIHVPRTGGSTIHEVFEWGSAMQFEQTEDIMPWHFTAREYKEKIRRFDHLFRFAFVRNPFDRFLSTYKFKNGVPLNLEQKIDDIEMFAIRLRDQYRKKDEYTQFARCMWLSQCDFLLINGELAVDFLGRFENYEEDFIKVCKMAHQRIPKDIPKLNSSNKKIELTDRARELVYDIYYEDFKTFGYK